MTKYLAGHSDVVLGAVVTSNAELRDTLLHHRIIHGGIAGPFEAWLALRGLRTLALRIERSQASAAVLAEGSAATRRSKASGIPAWRRIPGHDRAKSQMYGFGSILCVQVAPRAETSTAPMPRTSWSARCSSGCPPPRSAAWNH